MDENIDDIIEALKNENEKLELDEFDQLVNALVQEETVVPEEPVQDSNLPQGEPLLRDELETVPDPVVTEEDVAQESFAALEEAALQEEFAALEEIASQEEPLDPDDVVAQESFAALEEAALQEESLGPEDVVAQESFAALEEAALQEESLGPDEVVAQESFAALEEAALQEEPSAPEVAAPEEPELPLSDDALAEALEPLEQLTLDVMPKRPPGLLSRIFGLFKRLPLVGRLVKDTKVDAAFETYSKFKRFFEEMDLEDPLYPSVRQTSGLCDDALRIAKQRIQLGTRLQEYDEQLLELEHFSRLSEEEIEKLKKLLQYFMALTVERNQLYSQLSDFDKSLVDMFKLEEEAALAVPQIREAEERQRLLKQDLGYLYGEKADLVYERENFEKGLQFIHYFTLGLVGLFIVMTLLLGFLYIFNGSNIFLPTVIITLMVIIIASLLYIFRRRIRYELRINFKKQLRAVELLNKKNVVYAYYTNFLRFVYNKYKVRSSQMLENNLQNFGNYKFLVGRIDNLRRTMYETEAEIERFMKEKHLTGLRASVEGFAKTANLDDKKRYYEELLKSKEAVEKELNALDLRHEEIWDTLMVLNDNDRSSGKIVDKIIQTYLDEAGGLLTYVETA